MLRELTKSDWLSLLAIPADRVPVALLLRGTRNLKTNYEKHKALFADVLEVGSPNGIFEDVFIGRHDGLLVAYASVYGDAMASEITHVFGIVGASLVVQTGCCGALTRDILPGDLICATAAHCGEGAAQYYLPGRAEAVEASAELVDGVILAPHADILLHKGSIWTTSALLAEGRAELESWMAKGCVAADMETASTFAVAKHFGMRRLSLLFAFDNPSTGDHIALTDEAKARRRAAGELAMIELALSVVHRFAAACRPDDWASGL